jgi:hypothetical protein
MRFKTGNSKLETCLISSTPVFFLYLGFVLSGLVVIGAAIAVYLRIRRHMRAKPAPAEPLVAEAKLNHEQGPELVQSTPGNEVKR